MNNVKFDFYEDGKLEVHKFFHAEFNHIPSVIYCGKNPEYFKGIDKKVLKNYVFDLYSFERKQFVDLYLNSIRHMIPESFVYPNGLVETSFVGINYYDDEKGKKQTNGGCYCNDDYRIPRVVIIDYRNKIVVDICEYSGAIFFCDDADVEGLRKSLDYILTNIKKVYKKDDDLNVNVLCYRRGQLDIQEKKIHQVTVDVDANYNDDFRPVYEKLVEFIKDDSGCGLAILSGEPGTGKTTLIRDLISNTGKDFVIVPSSVSNRLDDPSFTDILDDKQGSIFILEDCEEFLQERSAGFLSSVSPILNLSDGLMSDIYNIKFICTFNTELTNIDPAILRKGRCVVNYRFDKLKKNKAKELLNKLGKSVDDCEDMTLAEIYNFGSDNGAENTKQKIGF